MTTNSFTHFLITRYNVPLEGWDKDKAGQPTRDETWHAHRKKLFEQFCVPSIRAQSNKEFTWLIYCDKNTPAELLREINHSLKDVRQAVIRFAEDYHDCMRDIDHQMANVSTQYVITSRLDNDDGLGIDYMETIQKHFVPEPNTIINLLHGHGYNEKAKVITRLINIRKNHFGSLIEPRNHLGGHVSIRGFQHGSPPSHFKILNVAHANSWLKIFHDRNLKSTAFGYPLFKNSVAKFYGVDTRFMPLDIIQTFRYTTWWLADGVCRKLTKRK